jgi:putative oxidoreductase
MGMFLIERLVLGVGLGAHGAEKLFGWFGSHGLEGTREMAGGLLTAVGLGGSVGPALIVLVMVVAADSGGAAARGRARPDSRMRKGGPSVRVRGVRVALLIPVIVGLGGCVVAPVYPPPPPAAGVVWVPGYYAPAPVGHIWISGHWRIR